MLYELGHIVRDRMPWVWEMVEAVNSGLFGLRYGQKLQRIEMEIAQRTEESPEWRIQIEESLLCKNGFRILPMREVETERMVEFFGRQPEEAFRFFRPHGFDRRSIGKLQRNRAFLAYVLMDGKEIAGYCFLRSFFFGKGFRGRMVDIGHRGQGLGTEMNRLLNRVGFGIGLRLYETVNRENVASYRSALAASRVRVVEEMDGGDLYLEIVGN